MNKDINTLIEAIKTDSDAGFCIRCGKRASRCIGHYSEIHECERCGEYAVFSAKGILYKGLF